MPSKTLAQPQFDWTQLPGQQRVLSFSHLDDSEWKGRTGAARPSYCSWPLLIAFFFWVCSHSERFKLKIGSVGPRHLSHRWPRKWRTSSISLCPSIPMETYETESPFVGADCQENECCWWVLRCYHPTHRALLALCHHSASSCQSKPTCSAQPSFSALKKLLQVVVKLPFVWESCPAPACRTRPLFSANQSILSRTTHEGRVGKRRKYNRQWP